MERLEFLRRKPGIPAVRWDGSEDGIAVIRHWIRAWTGNEPLTARRWMAQDDGSDQLCGVTIHGPNGDISLCAGDFVTMEQDGVFKALPQAEATKLFEFADGYHIAPVNYRGETASKPADECQQGLAVGEDFVTLGEISHAVAENARAMGDQQAATREDALRTTGLIAGDVLQPMPTVATAEQPVFTYTQAHPHFDLMTQLASRTGSGFALKDVGFDVALLAMKAGYRVARAGWNGKGMWICLGEGRTLYNAEAFWNKHTKRFWHDHYDAAWRRTNPSHPFADEKLPPLAEQGVEVLPYFIMKTADDKILMGWLASQTDLVATDWNVLED